MPTLDWIGKDKVVNHHRHVPFRVLERRYGFDGTGRREADDGGNMIVRGDNLEALKALLPRYEGRVTCVYIDPPYNTGNEGWVYNDNVNDPKIRKWLGDVVGREGEDLSRHDKWLCMMYPRLKLRLPQFMLATEPGLFSESGHVPLQQEHLYKGFTLTDKDAQIDFSTMTAEMARVDVDDAKDATPKAWKLTGVDGVYYKEWFASLPSKQRIAHCKQIVREQLSRLDAINDRELDGYIDRVMDSLTPDQLADLERSPFPFVQKIKEKIQLLLTVHAAGVFELWLEQGVISCLPSYSLPPTTSTTETTRAIPKSLYAAEEKMNDFEIRVVWGLSALDNVKWWHRNISRLGFCINGYLHAYPDIIVMTTSGKLLLVETKGDHLDNAESEQKARIGDKWETAAGKPFKYFMAFDKRQPSYPRAFALDRFMEIVKGL
jgi:type III restriction enzyme